MMRNSFIYSFKRSLPILIGFIPVGIAYGILMNESGYNYIWTGFTSSIVFAGSLQYLMISFFKSDISMPTIAVAAALLNSRHIFYGLSFIERFNSYKGWKWFLIFALPDETYSLHCSYKPKSDVNEKWVFVFSALLVWIYWIFFSVIGGLVGSLIFLNTDGIEFALTALFVVILIDQLKDASSWAPAVIAFPVSILFLLILGKEKFLLPSLFVIIVLLIAIKPYINQREERKENNGSTHE